MITKKYFIGNWKMGPGSLEEAREIYQGIEAGVGKNRKATVIICPPYLHIAPLAAISKHKVLLGAQDVFEEAKGPYTGEVSAAMLKDVGVSHIIIGHSSRRSRGETDEEINKKVSLALKEGFVPIICIGETVRDEDGHYLSVIKEQLEKALKGVTKKNLGKLIVAYEPVWAIGASEAMNARDVHEMMIFIRKIIVDMFKLKTPMPAAVVYGGSVDPTNAREILAEGGVGGLLVGRQSLSAQNFLDIINSI